MINFYFQDIKWYTEYAVIFAVVSFSRISRVRPKKIPLQFMSIFSNENIRKIVKLTPHECLHLAKVIVKISVRENYGVYSIDIIFRWSNIYSGDNCSCNHIFDNKELEWWWWLGFWFGGGWGLRLGLGLGLGLGLRSTLGFTTGANVGNSIFSFVNCSSNVQSYSKFGDYALRGYSHESNVWNFNDHSSLYGSF